jgi:hypothetical protein
MHIQRFEIKYLGGELNSSSLKNPTHCNVVPCKTKTNTHINIKPAPTPQSHTHITQKNPWLPIT